MEWLRKLRMRWRWRETDMATLDSVINAMLSHRSQIDGLGQLLHAYWNSDIREWRDMDGGPASTDYSQMMRNVRVLMQEAEDRGKRLDKLMSQLELVIEDPEANAHLNVRKRKLSL